MIELHRVSKSYGKIKALDKVSFSVQSGQFFGLLGPNGAGKSTIINILSTLLKATEGEIIIDGKSIENYTTQVKNKVGIVPQEISLYEEISALDNLIFWGGLYKVPSQKLSERVNDALKMAGLWNRRKDPIKSYSGGMKRRINIIASILHEPKILLLDEPTVGIDPQSRNRIFELIENLNHRGLTVVYTTHYMEEAERLCDKIAIMDNGQVVTSGTLAELKLIGIRRNILQVRVSHLPETLHSVLEKKHNMQIQGNELELKYDILTEDIELLLTLLKEHNVSATSIKTFQPNLESVFLELTGKKLRDN